jgi:hypothetical protein
MYNKTITIELEPPIPFFVIIGNREIELDARLYARHIQQYLEYLASDIDDKEAAAKTAYMMYTETTRTESVSEAVFSEAMEENLEKFTTLLCRQIVSEEESVDDAAIDIYSKFRVEIIRHHKKTMVEISKTIEATVGLIATSDIASGLRNTLSQIKAIMNPLSDILATMSEQLFRSLRKHWAALCLDTSDYLLLEKERKYIEDILFASKWFMFSPNIAVASFVFDVATVSRNRRIRNYDKHIGALVFKYITQDIINEISHDWQSRCVSRQIKRVMRESLCAYKQKKYASTVTLLSSLWQSIIADLYNYNGYRTDKKTKNQFATIVAEANAPEVISKFHNEYIWGDCCSVNDVIDGIPGRHAIAHGWLIEYKYPSRKTALNAILFTNFLMSYYSYDN